MRYLPTFACSASIFALSLSLITLTNVNQAKASTGCDSIGAEPTFTYTGPTGGSNSFVQALQGGANFTFNPGDVVTLTITVPALSRIDIAFAGGVGSVNNSGGGTPLTQTISFTVPDSGGPSSGAFTISGAVVGTNTATISFACVNAVNNAGATDANQAAATADTTLQSVVPGGLNGNVFGALNIPDFNSLFPDVFGQLEQRPAPAGAKQNISTLEQKVKALEAGLAAAVASFQQASKEASDAIRAHVAANAERVRSERAAEEATQAENLADQDERDKNERLRSALRLFDASVTLAENDESINPIRNFAVMQQVNEDRAAYKEAEAAHEAANAAKTDAIRKAHEARAAAEQARSVEQLAANNRSQTTQETTSRQDAVTTASTKLQEAKAELAAARRTLGNSADPALQVAQFLPSLPDLNEIHARFDLAAERREVVAANSLAARPEGLLGDKKFNLWFGGDMTLHRDRRSIGQEGESLSADGGVSYLVADDLNIGLAARYSHTDTEGDTGETLSDTYTLSVFAQQQIFDEAVIEAVIAYSLVDLDLTFKNAGAVTGTGSTDASSLAGQARITQRFALEGNWWVAPNLGASVVTTDRDAFTTSDGTAIGDSRSTQVALVGGPTFGTHWTVKGGGINYSDLTLSPSFGLSANYNLGRFDRVVDANNNVFETDRFGLASSAGVNFDLGEGSSLAFGTSYAGIGSDQQNISFNAKINIPLN